MTIKSDGNPTDCMVTKVDFVAIIVNSNLSVLYHEEIDILLIERHVDFYAGTWLLPGIYDSLVNIFSFNLHRHDL